MPLEFHKNVEFFPSWKVGDYLTVANQDWVNFINEKLNRKDLTSNTLFRVIEILENNSICIELLTDPPMPQANKFCFTKEQCIWFKKVGAS